MTRPCPPAKPHTSFFEKPHLCTILEFMYWNSQQDNPAQLRDFPRLVLRTWKALSIPSLDHIRSSIAFLPPAAPGFNKDQDVRWV